MRFVALDFETANGKRSSGCSIGIALFDDGQIVEEYYSLIHQTDFSVYNTKVHGIKESDCADAPSPDQTWAQVEHYFADYTPVVAYNASFDLSVMVETFGISRKDIVAFDPMAIYKDEHDGKHSLEYCAEFYGVEIGKHHNALDDAKAVGQICNAMMQEHSWGGWDELPVNAKYITAAYVTDRFAAKDWRAVRESLVIKYAEHSVLEGKNIVFTGDLLSMYRSDAVAAAEKVGAIVKSSVSRKVHYVVIGEQDPTVVNPSGISTKERKARELNATGAASIVFLTEDDFLRLLAEEI